MPRQSIYLQPVNLGACHHCVFSRLNDDAEMLCDNPRVQAYTIGIKRDEINIRDARENPHLCGPDATLMHMKGE